MTAKLDLVIIGSGPGGMAAGILAKKKNLSYIILEKGHNPMQGIIDTYPKGKKVYLYQSTNLLEYLQEVHHL